MALKPSTLGEKLAPARSGLGARLRNAFIKALKICLLLVTSALVVWWITINPDMDDRLMLALCVFLLGMWILACIKLRAPRQHDLLAYDHSDFMRHLRLDAKAAIIDGSNIYHLGHDKGLDAQPLGTVAHQLREEGYRIVCFFDANIFFTLQEHGALGHRQRHSLVRLQEIFGLNANEVYVVPSGVQADQFVLETLRHLPMSFAVTNDRFRDYADDYPDVMKGNLWRKGVDVSGDNITLLHHNP